MKLNIGKTNEGRDLDLDLPTLIESRALIQAQSGAGKSWAIRRLLEQSHGQVQQIVIDLEGEFSTLRSKFDYIIASKNGDVQASPKTAGLLAQKLMELQVSAICDLYELKAHDRIRFVRLFLESLMMVKKDLWRPILVVIDEAHHFCPEKGQAESAPSVIDLATRGRKRGFCLVAATQRLSKFHKDVCAELGNKLIGRTSLDIDQARAADELGLIGKADRTALRILRPGDFYAYGPAWRTDKQEAPGVLLLKVGPVETHHPKVGARFLETPPAPNAKVKDILAKLADLPQEAEEQARTTEDLRREITDLKRKLTLAEKSQVKPCDHGTEIMGLRKSLIDAERLVGRLVKRLSPAESFIEDVHAMAGVIIENKKRVEEVDPKGHSTEMRVHRTFTPGTRHLTVREEDNTITESVKVAKEQPNSFRNRPETLHVPKDVKKAEQVDGDFKINASQKRILVALSQRQQMGFESTSARIIGTLVGLKSTGGTFGEYLSRLRVARLIEGQRDSIRITATGEATVRDVEPLPIGRELIDWYKANHLNARQAEMLDIILDHPKGISRAELADLVGVVASGGTFGEYLSRMRSLGLIEGSSEIRLSQLIADQLS